MLVTDVSGAVKMSYHTTNTLNKDLSKIEDAYARGGAAYTFLYWKILSTFSK